MPTSVDARIKELERENAELRRANEILKTASAFFAQAELDTYWARKAAPCTDTEWDDAHMANTALDVRRANRSLYGRTSWLLRWAAPAMTSVGTRSPG